MRRVLLATHRRLCVSYGAQLPDVREKQSYNEEKTQNAPVSTNLVIRVCLYRHLRAPDEDFNRQPITRGHDGQVREAHKSHPDDKDETNHS